MDQLSISDQRTNEMLAGKYYARDIDPIHFHGYMSVLVNDEIVDFEVSFSYDDLIEDRLVIEVEVFEPNYAYTKIQLDEDETVVNMLEKVRQWVTS